LRCTLQGLQGSDAERDFAHVAAATLRLDVLQYTPERGRAFQDELLARVEALPGVTSAAIAPFEPFGGTTGITFRDPSSRHPDFNYAEGGALRGRFLETAGIRVLAGRTFSDADRRQATPAAAVISQGLANRLFPGGEPLGQRLFIADGDRPRFEVAIVGVCADVKTRLFSRGERAAKAIYLPVPLNYDSAFTLWIRTSGDPAQVLPHVRAVVRDMDSRLPLLRAAPVETWRDHALGPGRWIATGLAAMGIVALVLAAGGLYALMAFVVARRRHEMAIRLALGASATQLLRLMLGEGMKLSASGMATGLALAAIAAYAGRALLLGISPFDPAAFLGVAALLGAVALVASFFPARRAARLDPVATLRRQ